MRSPKVSILNLFLVTALIAMGFALSDSFLKARKSAAENQLLKQEIGYIEVEDPSKVYVRILNGLNQNLWRFRVFWPEGYSGRYLVGKAVLLPNGEPDLENISFQNGTFASHPVNPDLLQHEEQFTMLKLGAYWHFTHTVVSANEEINEPGFGTYFAEDVVDRFLSSLKVNSADGFVQGDEQGQFGHGEVRQFEVDETIVLVELTDPSVEEVFVVVLMPDKDDPSE